MKTWTAQGRNGHYAVDQYDSNHCQRTVAAGLTRQVAEIMADEAEAAYRHGRCDALRGVGDRLTETIAELDTEAQDARARIAVIDKNASVGMTSPTSRRRREDLTLISQVNEAKRTALVIVLAELEAFK